MSNILQAILDHQKSLTTALLNKYTMEGTKIITKTPVNLLFLQNFIIIPSYLDRTVYLAYFFWILYRHAGLET